MTTFWSLYITALTVGTLIALLWLVFATRKGEAKGTTEKTMGHSYDGIEEYDNPLPKWCCSAPFLSSMRISLKLAGVPPLLERLLVPLWVAFAGSS